MKPSNIQESYLTNKEIMTNMANIHDQVVHTDNDLQLN